MGSQRDENLVFGSTSFKSVSYQNMLACLAGLDFAVAEAHELDDGRCFETGSKACSKS